MKRFLTATLVLSFAMSAGASHAETAKAVLPDGRTITPVGFTIALSGGFPGMVALSPDGSFLAVGDEQNPAAVDVVNVQSARILQRVNLPGVWGGMVWTKDALFVSSGSKHVVYRFSWDPKQAYGTPLTRLGDVDLGPGFIGGIAYDAATKRLWAARTTKAELDAIDLSAEKPAIVERRLIPAGAGQPFDVALASNGTLVVSLYDRRSVVVWKPGSTEPALVETGEHPTRLLAAGDRIYVANANGPDVVELDTVTLSGARPSTALRTGSASGVEAPPGLRRFDLALRRGEPPGATPSGMALSSDGKRLFVAESGHNDVAIVDLASGRVIGRVPTAWYPTSVVSAPSRRYSDAYTGHANVESLWIASGKGMGAQADPGGEWNGTYAGILQHVVVEPSMYARWTAQVVRDDRLDRPLTQTRSAAMREVKHVVVIVHENKHFDEVFGDVPGVDGDPELLVWGRKYTPNAHALGTEYAILDRMYNNGESSIFGHGWMVDAMADEYHEENAKAGADPDDDRLAWSIWPVPKRFVRPYPKAAVFDFDHYKDLSELDKVVGPRVNTSAIFGPRGELFDECLRKGVSFRVYGEQLRYTPDGKIAPGLAAHAAPDYPGTHINFEVSDTDRADRFLNDVKTHGLAAYSYLTLPTDHTAGTSPLALTPTSYVTDNDAGLGRIVAGLSRRPDWRSTIVIVVPDDAQGTGDHVDSHRMPAFVVGPPVRRHFVSHVHYSQVSVLRTVEVLFGLDPLTIYDAQATPILDVLGGPVNDAHAYNATRANFPMQKNPGPASMSSPENAPMTSFASMAPIEIDDPLTARDVVQAEWEAVHGAGTFEAHLTQLWLRNPFDETFLAMSQ